MFKIEWGKDEDSLSTARGIVFGIIMCLSGYAVAYLIYTVLTT